MKSILNVKISIKLVVFSVVSSLFALLAIGFHFYYFLENNSLEKTKKHIEFFFKRFESDLETQQKALEKQTNILDNDQSLLASIYLINNYENFEKSDSYNAILLDEEKKILVYKLLEQAKFGFDDRILLYNQNQRLTAGVEKKDGSYTLFFNSFYSGVSGYYVGDTSGNFLFGDSAPLGHISSLHTDTYKDAPHTPPQKTFLIKEEALMMIVHHSIFLENKKSPIAHIEIAKVFDKSFLEHYSLGEESHIFWSKELDYENLAVTTKDLDNMQIKEEEESYTSALKYNTINGPLYLVFSQNKQAIATLLKKSINEFLLLIGIVVFILLGSMFFVYHYVLINPLKTLMANINYVKARTYNKIKKIHTEDELEEIAENIEDLAHNVRIKEKQLQYQVEHDTLTGLHDRYYFNTALQDAISNIKHNSLLSVIFIDIDQFKIINDTLGHHIGDKLLVDVSKRLHDSFAKFGNICRIGGDEFILIVENLKSKHESELIAQEIKHMFVEPFMIQDTYIKTSVSLGITFSSDKNDNPEMLLKEADIALYKSKERGRNRYTIYEEEFSSELMYKSKIINQLKSAILTFEEFSVVYQPKINLKTMTPHGVEALIRWNNKELGFVSPNDFISIAEESGMIVEIGYWILEKSCQDFVKLQKYGYLLEQLSVNVSSIQMQSENFLEQLQEIVTKTSINPKNLELEITERYIAQNSAESNKIMNSIRRLGIGLAIDDFGTGYSSLSYLKQLPVTRLKVDKSFIDGCDASTEELSVVKAIIGLAQTFNLQSTAEGVENKAQLQLLEELKCDEIQGYLFAKPMRLKELTEYLDKFYLATV